MPPAAPLPTPPVELPIFPLTGSLLLPGNWLPLNIFESRYRNMVEDAMAGEGWIGMIQPLVPQQDNWPALEPPSQNPPLYSVGCAGHIASCEPQADGRFHILLKGASRFRVRVELPLRRGYRRVAADYADFAADLNEAEAVIDPAPLLRAVQRFGQAQGLSFDLDVLAALPGIALLNGLAVALPFQPGEKQALLEASGPQQRLEMLLVLMGMGIDAEGDYYAPPTVH
jgi:uncharacterized protein